MLIKTVEINENLWKNLGNVLTKLRGVRIKLPISQLL